MSVHLSHEQIDKFWQGKSSRQEAHDISHHIENCESCKKLLLINKSIKTTEADVIAVITNFELKALEHYKHLSYHQIKDYVDNKIDDSTREFIDTHTEFCNICAHRLKELLSVQEELNLAESRGYLHVQLGGDTDIQVQGLDRLSIMLHKWSNYLLPANNFTALAMTSVALCILLSFFIIRITQIGPYDYANSNISNDYELNNTNVVSDPLSQAATTPTNKSIERFDNESNKIIKDTIKEPTNIKRRIALRTKYNYESQKPNRIKDVNIVHITNVGEVIGLENLSSNIRTQIEEAVRTKKLGKQVNFSIFDNKDRTLLSTTSNGRPFKLNTPVGVYILTDRPVFSWEPLEGATSYIVIVKDLKSGKTIVSPSLDSTKWSMDNALNRGTTYSWQVRAIKDGQEITSYVLPALPAKFHVIDEKNLNLIQKSKSKHPSSHLILGILYANMGLFDEANQEFIKLEKSYPNNPLILELRKSINELTYKVNN
jgi:hypothetical protein